jgi:transposase
MCTELQCSTMRAISEKRLEKAKKLAQMFEDFEKSGLSPTDFCKKEGIHTSKFYYWRARYTERGIEGLIDQREGVAYKMTQDVKDFILKEKMSNRLKSGIDLSRKIEDKFGKKISEIHIQQFLREHGLNDPVGRKASKHKIKKRVHAHKTSTLLRYLRTLFFLPAFGMERQ